MFNRIHRASPDKGFYKPIKRSREISREISIFKEDMLALGLLISNYAVKTKLLVTL